MVERLAVNQYVAGSSPAGRAQHSVKGKLLNIIEIRVIQEKYFWCCRNYVEP